MRMMCGTCLRESGASTIRGSGPAVLGRSAARRDSIAHRLSARCPLSPATKRLASGRRRAPGLRSGGRAPPTQSTGWGGKLNPLLGSRIVVYSGAALGAAVALAVFMPKLISDAAENPQYTSPILLLPYFAAGGVAAGAIAGLFVALVVGAVDRVLRRRWWIDVLVRAVAVGVVALCTHALVAASSDARRISVRSIEEQALRLV